MERTLPRLLAGICMVLAQGGCTDTGTAQDGGDDLSPVHLGPVQGVDVLFVMENTGTPLPPEVALIRNTPAFFQKLDAMGADYHIGITTSDVGSYVAPDTPWSISLGTCDSFTGDDGTLQRTPCRNRHNLTNLAIDDCESLCPDPSIVPTSQGFISKVNGVTNVPQLLMDGTDIGPQRAFQCMALVGDAGCEITGPFEGAKRALDGHNPLNASFLRPDSLLVVIFITHTDDCSVRMRAWNDPVTMDCPTPDKNAGFRCFNPGFRCSARDVVCDQPLNTPGEKTNCKERPDTYLESVSSYVSFFSSLRPADRLLIGGFWTLPSLDMGDKFDVEYRMNSRSDDLWFGQGSHASCSDADDPGFVGHPQLRLSQFAHQFKGSIETGICSVTSFPQALDAIASAIQQRLR